MYSYSFIFLKYYYDIIIIFYLYFLFISFFLYRQLDNFEKHAEQNQNINQITDEYTQRLSALERKFQQAIRERDSLRKNLEQLKVEAATRLSSQELSTLNAEKDEIIKELREEGEKLSKQQLQHSNIIKKLRVKEKENDALIKSQKYVSNIFFCFH